MVDFSIGFMSTIDNPLLPFFIAGAKANGVENIRIILDGSTWSQKDKDIWRERTDGNFEKVDGGEASIYFLCDASVPFYFVDSHNSENMLSLCNQLNIRCLFNAGVPCKVSSEIIDAMPNGVLNLHPGLLPQYRGCTAVELAIYNDDKIGNTAHFMDEGFDTGPIITSEWYEFPSDTDYQSIRTRVYRDGCLLAGKVLKRIQSNNITPKDGIVQSEGTFRSPIPDEKMKNVYAKIEDQKYKYQCL